MDTLESNVKDLRDAWALLFPAMRPPDDRQWALWLMTYSTELVKKCIAKLAVRYYRSPEEFKTGESLYKFASSIMRRVNSGEPRHESKERKQQ